MAVDNECETLLIRSVWCCADLESRLAVCEKQLEQARAHADALQARLAEAGAELERAREQAAADLEQANDEAAAELEAARRDAAAQVCVQVLHEKPCFGSW
jgi:F0F1-type ATP synthase membrane subunit b/b'